MALKKPGEYIESIRDERCVYLNGEKVADVTEHPRLKEAAEHVALAYAMAEDDKESPLAIKECDETGEKIAGWYKVPRNAQDLLDRRELIYRAARYGDGYIPFIKEIGTDAIFALRMICAQLDRERGTSYLERVKKFHHYCQENDLALAGAVTDPKGDRSLRPHEQPNQESFLRIVDRSEEGITVRGAKCHITSSPLANELVVLPTRGMAEEDKDYAVAFAAPVNTPGIKVIANPESASDDPFESPLSNRHPIVHGMVIFDDVFVPWERVFLNGEWEWAGHIALAFASWHRYTGLSYKGPVAELMVGAAALIADYNGVGKASNVRSKLRELVMYTESIRTYSMMAAYECKTVEGIAWPSPLHCNIGKYLFADNYHVMLKHVQEVAGGIGGTCPSVKDYNHPDLKGYIDHYLGGREGISTEARMRVLKLVRDLTASGDAGVHMFGTVHGEGTLEAQRIMMLREYDMRPCIDLAVKAAGLSSKD